MQGRGRAPQRPWLLYNRLWSQIDMHPAPQAPYVLVVQRIDEWAAPPTPTLPLSPCG